MDLAMGKRDTHQPDIVLKILLAPSTAGQVYY